MSVYHDIGREAADQADRIGCGYSTQAGEMPSPAEVDRVLADALAEARSGLHRFGSLRRLAALAIFAVGLETWADRHAKETK